VSVNPGQAPYGRRPCENKIREAELLPSFGTVGHGLNNAMMKSFWSSMQIDLLKRQKWRTCMELANAIFEYIKVF